MSSAEQIRAALQYAECHEDVTRKGESVPCDAVAVALRIDPTEGNPYPVCAYHARATMVSLTFIAALLPEAFEFEEKRLGVVENGELVPTEMNTRYDTRLTPLVSIRRDVTTYAPKASEWTAVES